MTGNVTLLYSLLLIVSDFVAILLAFVLAYVARVTYASGRPFATVPAAEYLQAFLLLIPLWLIIFGMLGLYNKRNFDNRFSETARLAAGSLVGVLLVIGYEFTTTETVFPTRSVALYGLLTSFLLLLLGRTLLKVFRRQMFKTGFGVTNIMLIGSTVATKKLAALLANTSTSGYHVAVVVGSKTSLPAGFDGKHHSSLSSALKDIDKLNVHSIVQTQFYDQDHRNKLILEAVQEKHLSYKLIPTHEEFFTGNHSVDIFHGFPVVSVHHTRLLGWGKVVKRIMDFFVSLVMLIALSPILLVVTILLPIFDFGPVFFKHKRITRYGRKVSVYKFRTMKKKYSGKDPVKVFETMGRKDLIKQLRDKDSQINDDPRVSVFGGFLRRTSIDELPQLWNVLKGDMSLVGPRAIIPEEMKLYKEYGNLLLAVKTGITGMAQVAGRSDLDYQERTRLNLYYVQNWTIWLDITILLKTVVVVFKGNNTK